MTFIQAIYTIRRWIDESINLEPDFLREVVHLNTFSKRIRRKIDYTIYII